MNLFKKSIAGTSVLALALSVTAVSFVSVSPTAAYAERGGNGNGKGNGNSNRDRSRNDNARGGSERGGSDRGRVARELRGLNAAHANQNALENASSDSMPGKLYVYQQAQQEYAELAAVETAAGDKYLGLVALTDDEKADLFPAPIVEEPPVVEGEEAPAPETVAYDVEAYDAAVAAALGDLEAAEADAQEAETTLQTSLGVLTKGDDLSDAALAELNRLLGL